MNKPPALSIILVILFLPHFNSSLGCAQEMDESSVHKGTIKGRVIDYDIKSPLLYAKVRIADTSLETFTDKNGNFNLPDIPVGNYTIEISCRFYVTRLVPDVIVKSQRITYVRIELHLDKFIQEEEITVMAGYFSTLEEQPASVAQFSYEEIRRAAGSAGDVSRIISSLPSIARVNDMVNNLVVRGGSPAENAFYIDNIEISNINHYPTLGSTAGAIGLLNVDFIRDVRFYSGGFSPIYGEHMSSIMDISFREGNRDEHDFQLGLDMMGFSAVGEGPLAKDGGSWMFSARRSYLDLLINLMGSGVPVTWSDFQGKLNYDLSSRNKLTFLGVMGIDQSGTKKEDALKDRESYYGSLDTTEHTVGMNWFAMWSSNGYSNTSISQSRINYKYDSYETVSEELMRQGKSLEQSFILRNINSFRLNEKNTFIFGLEIKHLLTDYDYHLAEYTDFMGNTVPDVVKDIRVSANRYAIFANHSWNPFSKFTFNIGLRLDHFSYNQATQFSPRLSLSLKLSEKTSINAAAGIFHQNLPLVLLFQNENHKKLKIPVSYHLVLGMRHLLSENTRLSLEVYRKDYAYLPLDPSQPSLFVFDESFYGGFFAEHESLMDTGRARSFGLELMIQKKLADKLYGVVSVSYFRARYRDLYGTWRNRVYDNRYIFSAEGGYKPNKYWEFSLKWNYAGGAPYTPFDIEASRAVNSGIFDWNRINRERLSPYHSINIRFDKRFYFRESNLIVYFSVWNIFNRKNVIANYWNAIEMKPDRILGWGILPALGVEFEF